MSNVTPLVSVIIPTYNRKDSLLRTLNSLNPQVFPEGNFEVIVVDDGSTDDSECVCDIEWSFEQRYIHQKNYGPHMARNEGAKVSRGEVLIFIDDDVTIRSNAIFEIKRFCLANPSSVVMGTVFQRCRGEETMFSRYEMHRQNSCLSDHNEIVSPAQCNTQFLAVRRDDFFEIGMMQGLPGSYPSWAWDDVEFGYRAHLLGYSIIRCVNAVAEHWDYSISALHTASDRWRALCRNAAILFQIHPGLMQMLPMFRDKMPVSWKTDPSSLILRKCLRHVASTKLMMTTMIAFTKIFERSSIFQIVLHPLYRWIIGGMIYRGFHEGLKEFGLLDIENRINGRIAHSHK